jgi:hypothetical protein
MHFGREFAFYSYTYIPMHLPQFSLLNLPNKHQED